MRGTIIRTAMALAIVIGSSSLATAQPGVVTGWQWFGFPQIFGGMQVDTAQADDDTPKADEVVDKMQSYYENARTFSAEFKQVYEEVNGLKKNSSGVVFFKKGGKMRWDYEKPEEKYLFSNGEIF